MSEKDVVITYETLFELLRIEKNREDIQKLEDSFFDDVIGYIKNKRESAVPDDGQTSLFTPSDKDKTRLELDNIKKILKDIYDRRERKILNTALTKARTGATVVNTSNMLTSEKLLFDYMSSILCDFRNTILVKLACGEMPDVSSLSGKVPAFCMRQEVVCAEPSGINELKPAIDVQKSFETEPKDLKISPNFSDSGASIRKVRLLASVGEIVGPDLQIYGPFEEGSLVELPNELVRVLVEKNQAEFTN